MKISMKVLAFAHVFRVMQPECLELTVIQVFFRNEPEVVAIGLAYAGFEGIQCIARCLICICRVYRYDRFRQTPQSNSINPGAKTPLWIVCRDVTKSVDERVLQRVLRIRMILATRQQKAEKPIAMIGHQCAERIGGAVRGSFDQICFIAHLKLVAL